MKTTQIIMNNPVYLDLSISEISELVMMRFAMIM